MNRVKAVLGTAAVGLTVIASCVACSSSGNKSSSPATSGSATTGSTSSTPSTGSSSSKSADPSMSAVTVGFHNMEGGQVSLPDVRYGFEAGLKYVNDQLGGINGHPLKAVECNTDGTPEASVNCANQFVQKNVSLAVQGEDFGADAMLPVLKSAGLAEFGSFALTPGMDKAVGQAYFTEFSQEEGYAADLIEQKNLGATSLAIAMADSPTDHSVASSVIEPAAKKIGLTVKIFYYPTTGTDWTSEAATILSTKPSAITLWVYGGDALSSVPAFRAAGFTGTINAGTSTQIVSSLSAAQLGNTNFATSFYTTDYASAPPAVQAELDTFKTYIKPYTKVQQLVEAQQGYYTAVMTALVLQQVSGDPTSAKDVYASIGKAKGSAETFRTNGYDCSTPSWPGTTACGSGFVFAKVVNKKLVALPNQPVDVSSVRPSS